MLPFPVRRAGFWSLAALLAALLAATLALLALAHWPFRLQAAPARQLFLPLLTSPPAGALLIAAAHVDSALSGEADEAILLWNTSPTAVDLADWQLAANGRTAHFGAGTPQRLDPGAWIWCTAQAEAFRISFGVAPGCEWGVAGDPALDDPAIPNLEGGSLRLTNTGGVIHLLDPADQIVDTLLYGETTTTAPGWQGPPAQLYTRGAVSAAGQLYHRKLPGPARLPLDRDTAEDWGGDLADLAWGRRVRWPGWQSYPTGDLARPLYGTATATTTVAIGPEGLYTPIAQALESATTSIDLSLYTFEHPELAQIVAAAAARGVRVRLLLEGAPPGGVTDFERWCVRQIAAAGGEVRFLAAEDGAPKGLQPRYRYTHAKFGLIDGRLALVGTENFGWESMPVPAGEPVGGRRGAYLISAAPPVVEGVAHLFAADWAPERFADLQPYTPDHPKYGDPPADYAPPAPPSFKVAAAPFTQTVSIAAPARYALVSAPEHALDPDEGLYALLQRAGPGDAIHLVQLYEHKYCVICS